MKHTESPSENEFPGSESESPSDGTRAFLGLGSNLGDRRSYLQQAVLWLASGDQPESAASPSSVAPSGLVASPSSATPSNPAALSSSAATAGSALEVVAVSPVYETAPIGGPSQGAYLNIVIEVLTTHTPRDLLRRCLEVEQFAGRIRRERWGPRTLDIDVLWMENITLNEQNLTIPHPRMWQRRFVMIPLGDLAPEFLINWEDPKDGDIDNVGDLFELPWSQVKLGIKGHGHSRFSNQPESQSADLS